MTRRLFCSACAIFGGCIGSAAWAMQLELVTVGNPGNAPCVGPAYGSVAYTYQIGKFEITAGQYTGFLNAVGSVDTYGLYNSDMVVPGGCNITRTGSPGNYAYSVAPDWANRPVNHVNWADAARFCNWLTNGQPSGLQDASTTEDGSYLLDGANTGYELNQVTRKPDARYVIPNVDEWFKAAYYDPQKTGYWTYATRSDTLPSNVLSATGTNNANIGGDTQTLGAPYFRTEVGAFAGSPSGYGTFDQTGNVFEWEENASSRYNGGEGRTDYFHAMTGGSYIGGFGVGATAPYEAYTLTGAGYSGFRVAVVPEASTSLVLLIGGVLIVRREGARLRG